MHSWQLCQAVSNILPVDHLPDVFQVLGPQIVVLLVVGVLPHINAQNRCQALQSIDLVSTEILAKGHTTLHSFAKGIG